MARVPDSPPPIPPAVQVDIRSIAECEVCQRLMTLDQMAAALARMGVFSPPARALVGTVVDGPRQQHLAAVHPLYSAWVDNQRRIPAVVPAPGLPTPSGEARTRAPYQPHPTTTEDR